MASDIETEVVETELKLLTAINAGDADTVLQHMHPDWSSFWPGGLRLFNSAAGCEGIRETFAMGFAFKMRFQDLNVKIYDNFAIAVGYLAGTATEPDGQISSVTWRITVIRIRIDGEWKIIHWHESPLVGNS